MIRKTTMEALPKAAQGILRIFFITVVFGAVALVVLLHVASPDVSPSYPAKTLNPTRVVFVPLGVTDVLGSRSQSEVANSVVERVAVDVIGVTRGELSVNIEPSQSVKVIANLIYADTEVSVVDVVTYGFTLFSLVADRLDPSKNSRFRVVVEEFFESLLGELVSLSSHKANNKGQQREVETVTGLLLGRKGSQIFGLSSTSCRRKHTEPAAKIKNK